MCSDMAEKLSLSLRWGSHQETVLHSLENCFGAQDFVDLTLACEGQSVQAHRVVVSACSSFIKKLLQDHPCSHPIIILKDVAMSELKLLLEFMYSGQVTVEQRQLESLLQAAQVLGIRGLADVDCSESAQSMTSNTHMEEESKTDDTTKSQNLTLSGNKSILASYLSASSSAQSFTLAELLSQPALNTNYETPTEEQENKSSSTGSVSEIDFEVKQEVIDLGVDTEFHDAQTLDASADLEDNLHPGHKGIGKATAFMLTLAKRANRVAALPYSAHRPNDRSPNDVKISLTEEKTCLLCGQGYPDDVALAVHTRNVHSAKSDSGHSRTDESSGEHKLAFYESRPCSVCGKMYRDAASLRTHTSIMHTTWRGGFECSCNQVFDTKYEMYQHRKSHGKSGRLWTPAT